MEAPRRTIKRARALRGRMTLPEVLLWQVLRGSRLERLRFRRQHPVGPFILDFYCAAARLAVEVDGEAHHRPGRPQHDASRDAWLEQAGIRTLRLSARLVLKDMDAAVQMILREVGGRLPQSGLRPDSSPSGGASGISPRN
ncbi:MAG: endonuclease domain-containing protein [Caulobacter sp.]